MRIKTLKKFLWVLNAVLVAGIVLVALKFFILDGKKSRRARAATEILESDGQKLRRALPKVKREELGPPETYQDIYRVSIDGPLPPEPEPESPEGPIEETRTDLEREYTLLWVKVDPEPFDSMAHLVPTNEIKNPKAVLYIQPGEKVKGWMLKEVKLAKAVFENEKSGETVTLEQLSKEVPDFGPGPGPGPGPRPPTPPGEPPPESGPTREAMLNVRRSTPNNQVWEMPKEEADFWSFHGEKEAQKVAVQPRKNPTTGRPDGVIIRKIERGSWVEKRGLKQGDVIKSINGVAVNSREEAVTYVKGPGKGRSRYDVVVERAGRLVTFTYNVRNR